MGDPGMLGYVDRNQDAVYMASKKGSERGARSTAGAPEVHRTVDRATRILEEVVYRPGMTFAELARALDAPKRSVYGFIRGLLAKGWLYETAERDTYWRRHRAEDPDLVDRFLEECEKIRKGRIATNMRLAGTRFAIATAVLNQAGEAVASVTPVGPTPDIKPRAEKLGKLLIRHVDAWARRSMKPREAI